MLDTYRNSSLRTLSPLEEQVHNVFTKFAFQKFQEEFERATQYIVLKFDHGLFVVQYYKNLESQRHQVKWQDDLVRCSCKNFEFWGIICRHILSVFLHQDCFQISGTYLPLRWQRDEFQENGGEHVTEETINIVDLGEKGTVQCPPVSVTKGRPRKTRLKGGKELAKKPKHCKFCKAGGHNITTCPEKENSSVHQVVKKRKKEITSTSSDNNTRCNTPNTNPILLSKF